VTETLGRNSGQEVKGDRNFRQELLDMKLRVTGSLGRSFRLGS
jgi:hypothetical protein